MGRLTPLFGHIKRITEITNQRGNGPTENEQTKLKPWPLMCKILSCKTIKY